MLRPDLGFLASSPASCACACIVSMRFIEQGPGDPLPKRIFFSVQSSQVVSSEVEKVRLIDPGRVYALCRQGNFAIVAIDLQAKKSSLFKDDLAILQRILIHRRQGRHGH